MMLYVPVDNFLVMTISCLPGVLNQYLGHNACSDSDGGESRTSIRFDLQSNALPTLESQAFVATHSIRTLSLISPPQL